MSDTCYELCIFINNAEDSTIGVYSRASPLIDRVVGLEGLGWECSCETADSLVKLHGDMENNLLLIMCRSA